MTERISAWSSLLPGGASSGPKTATHWLRELKEAVAGDALVVFRGGVTGTAAAGETDGTIFCNSITPVTVQMPSSIAINGKLYIIKNIGTGLVTINAGDGIEGYPSIYLRVPGALVWLQSIGAGWRILHSQMLSYVNVSGTTAVERTGDDETYPQCETVTDNYNVEWNNTHPEMGYGNYWTPLVSGLYCAVLGVSQTAIAGVTWSRLAIRKNGVIQQFRTFPSAFGAGGLNRQAQTMFVFYASVGEIWNFTVSRSDNTTCLLADAKIQVAKL